MTPDAIIGEARGWVGVPFRHQGRSREGVDCVGLPIVVLKALQLLPREFTSGAYGRLPTGEIVTRLEQHCRRRNGPARPGDLVVIAWTKTAAHIAICTGDTLIHSYESVGRVIEHGYRGRWVRMTHSVWEIPGVVE